MKIHFRISIILIAISLQLFLACNSDSKSDNETSLQEISFQDSLLQKEIRYPKKEITLNEKALDEAEKWMLYIAMEGEIKRMKAYSIQDVISNAPSILRASDTLMKTIPKKFSVKPIESRIKVLHTKVSVLNQLCQKQQKDIEKIQEIAEEIPVDFFNLKIQLNEVFIEMPEIESIEQ